MDLYTATAYDLSRRLTERYSTSFSLASRLYSKRIRPHIYAVYGMVRVADEIVDTYDGSDARSHLETFYAATLDAVDTGYSTNPILHSFAMSARTFGIDASLIDPFFESMRMDLTKTTFTKHEYDAYVYGSAEVVGLMCLKVFCDGNDVQYAALSSGARHLGSAYQKVNFLRDIRADFEERGRVYFPDVSYGSFEDTVKQRIVKEILHDFQAAETSVEQLPVSARRAVATSYRYYAALLAKLDRASAADIKTARVRVSSPYKLSVFALGLIGRA